MGPESLTAIAIDSLMNEPEDWFYGTHALKNETLGLYIWHANGKYGLAVTTEEARAGFVEEPSFWVRRKLWRLVKAFSIKYEELIASANRAEKSHLLMDIIEKRRQRLLTKSAN